MSVFFKETKFISECIVDLPIKSVYKSIKLGQIGKYMHTLYTVLSNDEFIKFKNKSNDFQCSSEALTVTSNQNYFVIYTYNDKNKNYLIFAQASNNKRTTKCDMNDECDYNNDDDNIENCNLFQYRCYELGTQSQQFKKCNVTYTKNIIVDKVIVFYTIVEFERSFNPEHLNMVAHGQWDIKNDSFVYLGTHITDINYDSNKQTDVKFHLIKHITNDESKWGINTIENNIKTFSCL